MSMRKLTVDGIQFLWTVGSNHIHIKTKDTSLLKKTHSVDYTYGMAVTPRAVVDVIINEFFPEEKRERLFKEREIEPKQAIIPEIPKDVIDVKYFLYCEHSYYDDYTGETRTVTTLVGVFDDPAIPKSLIPSMDEAALMKCDDHNFYDRFDNFREDFKPHHFAKEVKLVNGIITE